MAEAFARHYGQGRVEAYSAGSRPRGEVDEGAIAVMKEKGLDISGHASKGLDDLPRVTWDVIVTMGCGDACPAVPAKRRLDWQIPPPTHSPDQHRQVRDQIDEAVKGLVAYSLTPT